MEMSVAQRQPLNVWKRKRRRAPICMAIFLLYFLSCDKANAFTSSFPILDSSGTKNTQGSLHVRILHSKASKTSGITLSDEDVRTLRLEYDSNEIQQHIQSLLQKQDAHSAFEIIMGMFEFLEEDTEESSSLRENMSSAIDQASQKFFGSVFSPPYRGKVAKARISLGIQLLDKQLSNKKLVTPYDSLPKSVLMSALKALTGLNEVTTVLPLGGKLDNTDAAYRILQRLVTGTGVRHVDDKSRLQLVETDFNLVLNAYSNSGRMDMAHRVVALQERTPTAPMLSPVTFSILLKGYGKMRDLYNVDMLLDQADGSGIVSDVIMLNSAIDAYVNCGNLEKARLIFDFMKRPSADNSIALEYPSLFDSEDCPLPNRRTYNIFLKGLARQGLLQEAQELARSMQAQKMWDHVTTNTLVQAAVNAYDFDTVEEILEHHTIKAKKKGRRSHPNAEAYTTAIDGFTKDGDMHNALSLFKKMKTRGVDPNEFTYTCVIGALAKNKNADRARKMLQYMKSEGVNPSVVTYNALISGLMFREGSFDDPLYDAHINEAIYTLRLMMKEGIRPNAVTVSVLLGGFAKSDHPRLREGCALLDKLESDGIVSKSNIRIATALIQLYGAAGMVDDALSTFDNIRKPDIAAVNAILDVCVRMDKDYMASKIFEDFCRNPKARCRPDVISYSMMISSALKKVCYDGSKEARTVYEEMKFRRRISPDKTLVDIILKAMIDAGSSGSLTTSDVRFVAGVLRDAEKLEWTSGMLERRKRAVKTVMTGRISGAWEEESSLFGLTSADDYEDELFKKHGWNKVDSGFSLWGSKSKEKSQSISKGDDFLQSKGWNNVDSGFRII